MAANSTADCPPGADAVAALDYGLLASLLGYKLRRAQLKAFQDFAATMEPFALTPGRLGVLLLIEANPGLNQTMLARAMGLDRSTIVALVDELEGRDLVRRTPSPEDRRSHALILTSEGVRFLKTIRPHLVRHEERLAANLSARERRLLTELLGRITGL